MPARRSPVSASVLLRGAFFVSGGAALVFETLWFRQAGLTFGNSAEASSIVLAAFMAGLAVGNLVAARIGDRLRRPLRVFAAAEAAVAVSGVLLVIFLPSLSSILSPLFAQMVDQPVALNTVRLVAGFGLLMIPSTAMGITLPILVRALARVSPNYGVALGGLYGWNTLGGVAGAVCAESLIASWGTVGTGALAGGLDLLVAVCVVAMLTDESASDQETVPEQHASSGEGRLLTAAFLSGACLLALEVVWFRFLHLFVHSTTAAFAVMLAVVLGGIGTGGALAGEAMRRRDRADRLAWMIAFVAGTVCVLSYALFGTVHDALGRPFAAEAVTILTMTAVLAFPVALLSGLVFTLVGSLLNRQAGGAADATGRLAFWNTLGAGVGALLGGYVLLPHAGVEGALWGIALAYGAVGVLLMPGLPSVREGIAPAALALSLIAFPFGTMRMRHVPVVAARFGYPRTARIAATRESLTESIIYLENHLAGVPISRQLVTNGFSMASTSVFNRRYMKLFVYLAEALHPRIRTSLLISYGVGSTARALCDVPGMERIDIVDISRDVLDLSEVAYPDPARNPVLDPRVRTIVEDGRQFLQVGEGTYDLITSEPPPPKHAGVVNLYTREYFELIRSRLAPGGICTYWLPVHTLDPEQALSVMRAFQDAFEDASLWTGSGTNWILVGSNGGLAPLGEEDLWAPWRDPVQAAELRALGVERPEQMLALFLSGPEHLRTVTRDAAPLVDAFPGRLGGFRVDRARQADVYGRWMNGPGAYERFAQSDFVRGVLSPDMIESAAPYFRIQGMVNRVITELTTQTPRARRPLSVLVELDDLLRNTELTTLPQWHLHVWEDLLVVARQLARTPSGAKAWDVTLAASSLANRNYAEAARRYTEALKGRPAPPGTAHLALYALIRAGRNTAAARLAADLPRAAYDRDTWTWLSSLGGIRLPEPR